MRNFFFTLNEPFPKEQLNIEKDKTKQANENNKTLQNDNKSLIDRVKSSEQTIEALSEKLKEAEESNKTLKKAHDNLVNKKESLATAAASSPLKRKSIGEPNS